MVLGLAHSGGIAMICPRCDEWFGSLEFHCAECCLTFNTLAQFDRHRIPVRSRGIKTPWWEDAAGVGPGPASGQVRCAT